MRYLKFNGNTVEVIETDPIEFSFEKQEFARVFVKRDEIDESNFERGQTEFLLVNSSGDTASEAEFGGVLRDIKRQESVSEIVVESFERYAKDATPTSGDDLYKNTSADTIVQDAIDSIPQLSAGSVESVGGSISTVFSHASQAKKIRTAANAVGAEIRYNPDKTVDFLQRRGSDRSSSLTLSPDNQNITGDFSADKISGDKDITHLRIIGAGEGVHQETVNYVPQSDSTDWSDLDNVFTYNASHWSDGDRFEWTVKAAKEQQSVDGLKELANSIISDVQEEIIEVETEVVGEDLSLGDTVRVEYPEEQINGVDLRVVELDKKRSNKGIFDRVTLSSRRVSRNETEGQKERADLENYNRSFEGTPVTIGVSGGRQSVKPSLPYQMTFYYPDEVEYEHRTNLRIKSLPFRASVTNSDDVVESLEFPGDVGVRVNGSVPVFRKNNLTTELETESGDSGANGNNYLLDTPSGDRGTNYDFSWSRPNDNFQVRGETFNNSSDDDPTWVIWGSEVHPESFYKKYNKVEVEFEVNGVTDKDSNVFLDISIGTATLFEKFVRLDLSEFQTGQKITESLSWDAFNSNFDLRVRAGVYSEASTNGTSSDPQFGDVTIYSVKILEESQVKLVNSDERVIDIGPELYPGQYNDIRIIPEALGDIQAHIDIDVYRQILGNG